jgi:imidazolonepropionase
MKILLRHIKQLATPMGIMQMRGKCMQNIAVESDVDIVIEDGRFSKIGHRLSVDVSTEDTVIDASGYVATPSFVDPHTHIPFYGFRHKEFFLRQKGAGYLEILQAGGGILETTRQVRNAPIDAIVDFNLSFVQSLKEKGVLVMEGKSGYGLDLNSEYKQLEALEMLEEKTGIRILKTFLGPHAVPPEYTNAGEYIQWLCDVVLPELAKYRNRIDFIDVFCEKGVFNYDDSEKYLKRGIELGFRTRLHAEEMSFEGGSLLGVKVGALSVDHLIAIEQKGIEALSGSHTLATLLPGTSLFLNKPFAPARTLIDNNVAVALASDFNPGSCTIYDPTLIAFLAASKLKMTAEEILTAQTLNAAAAVGLAHEWGSIEEGKQSGLLLWNLPDFSAIAYLPGHQRLKAIISPSGIIA